MLPSKGPLVGKTSKVYSRKLVLWLMLMDPFVKLNFDGLLRGNPSRSSFSFLMWGHINHILKDHFYIMPSKTNNVVKAKTALEDVRLALSSRVECIHIKGESQLVIIALIFENVIN